MSRIHFRVIALAFAGAAAVGFSPATRPAAEARFVPGRLESPGPIVPPGAAGPAQPSVRRYVVAPTGNEARYRVREQLASLDFPNDAVGATRGISGRLLFDANGRVIGDSSVFVVDVRQLKSDRERRDRYLQRRTLQTDSFPTVELRVTSIGGLSEPLTATADTGELIGELTIRGVTRPTTWRFVASHDGPSIVGRASTAFNFTAFGIAVPRVASVLSIEDNIRLEYDFRLIPDTADGS